MGFTTRLFRQSDGQIALPFILLVSGIIIEITVAGSFIAYFLNSSGLGERLALRASAAAHSGVRDAMVRIARDKEFGASSQMYVLEVGEDTVDISVSRVVDNPLNVYIYTIAATAVSMSRQKRFVAVLVVDQTTGHAESQSLKEEPVN